MNRMLRYFALAIFLATCSVAAAQTAKYENVGRTATPDEIKALDISINPVTGQELPPGKGTAKEGAPIFAAKCAVCHGPTSVEPGPLAPRVAGPRRLVGTNFFSMDNTTVAAWPYATTIWDYINRAMPRFNEGTLTHDQVYALAALLLFRSGIIKEDDVMDAKSLTAVKMPNREGYVPWRLEDIGDMTKRVCQLGHCTSLKPTAAQ